jgi:hypothetical protein
MNNNLIREEVTNFAFEIERLVSEKKMTYIEAVVFHCETTGLEHEVAAKLITGALKSKIKMEYEELHFLPKSNTAKLPI